jgi:hypothetical protein
LPVAWRKWLDNQAREWYLHGLTSSLRQTLELHGRERLVARGIQAREEELLAKYDGLAAGDETARTHLKQACLALAAYQRLLPWLRSEERVVRLVQGQLGLETARVNTFLLRGMALVAALTGSARARDGFWLASHCLRGLGRDWGQGFAAASSVTAGVWPSPARPGRIESSSPDTLVYGKTLHHARKLCSSR